MGKWQDLAARLEARDNRDNRDDRDNSSENRANVPNVPNVLALVPQDVLTNLHALAAMAAPKVINPTIWPEIVSDAMRLRDGGWLGQAFALGWSALDLFGAMPDPDGDPLGDGLAVRLAGRRMLAISEQFATVEEPHGRSFLHRPAFLSGEKRSDLNAVLLWELSR